MSVTKGVENAIAERFNLLKDVMDERMTRLWVAAEARSHGRGGPAAVTRATGIREKRIWAGMRDLEELEAGPPTEAAKVRVRRPGAGRPALTETDPELLPALEALVDPVTRGEPNSPLRWTSKSLRKLSTELHEQGHPVSPTKVGELLHDAGYSLQANKKTREGSRHPDRNAQFEYINERATKFQEREQPVVSVDTKKKELVGDFKNGGVEWQPQGSPEKVRTHDFIDRELGKVIPYGIYDLARNEGWVSVGIDHDTSEFAVASIEAWWNEMGRDAYPDATELLITADNGGSNGSRVRLWRKELQRFADASGLTLTVLHFPPGTSKWNKIEHRLFSHITKNWRGRPLVSREAVVNLITNTTTEAGLRVRAQLDEGQYEKGLAVTKEEVANLSMTKHDFHGDWNYTIAPQT